MALPRLPDGCGLSPKAYTVNIRSCDPLLLPPTALLDGGVIRLQLSCSPAEEAEAQ